jgi:hypothetical protein
MDLPGMKYLPEREPPETRSGSSAGIPNLKIIVAKYEETY